MSCNVFGHEYHETTGVCHYCERTIPMPAKPKAPKFTWHVVTSADGTIFGVFGAKLKAAADLKAKTMSNPGATFYVDTVTRTRKPLTGTRLF